MAIGDQVHWAGTSAGTDLRPSSGVEVIVKEVYTSWVYTSGYNYFMYIHHRTSGYNYTNAIINGNTQYSGSSGYRRATSHGSENKNTNFAASPINYTYYLRSDGYGSGQWKVAGYITKE